jgi:hypothetical protein
VRRIRAMLTKNQESVRNSVFRRKSDERDALVDWLRDFTTVESILDNHA